LILTRNDNHSYSVVEGTAFFWAALNGNERGVEMFLQKSNINEQTKAKYISSKGGNVTILMAAVWSANVNLVRFLLENGADANLVDESYQTALMKAVNGGNEEIVKLLLPVSDGKATNWDGNTALMEALNGENEAIVKLLLPVSDAKSTNWDGNTTLMEAANRGNEEIVNILLPVHA
jgi:ankyrin repeat protein